jgi:hypothetical protein
MATADIVATAKDGFYEGLVPFRAFADITDPGRYRPLPPDWVVGVTDIVQSTKAIAEGRYKAVNTVGAAVIAAITNALPGVQFPSVFSGDGASLALPGRHEAAVRDTLARTAAWAEDALGLVLRVAVIPIAEIRAAGVDVRVARFAASADVTYAMFAGGGIAWAESALKQGRFAIARAAAGAMPDLSGLSCNFAPIRAERGVILSIIAVPLDDGPGFAALVGDLLALLGASGQAGRPFADAGPLPAWTGGGYERAIAVRAARHPLWARAAILPRALLRRLVLSLNLTVGNFHPARYRRQLVDNTDFRKFDDGLRMTVDCTPSVADTIEARLEAARQAGVCDFGTYRQKTANVTCFVPSVTRADHVHFVDGATGGYAAAATQLKQARAMVLPAP